MDNDFKKDVSLAIRGDSSAFSRLYSKVYKKLYYIALCSLRNTEDAADIVSDTVLDAFNSIKKLKNEEAFSAWITKILTNKIKRKQSEYINKAQYNYEDFENSLKADFDFEKAELAEEIYRLDNEERVILSLSVLGGYSSEEISSFYGLKPSSIRSKLSRTKEKLKKAINEIDYASNIKSNS